MNFHRLAPVAAIVAAFAVPLAAPVAVRAQALAVGSAAPNIEVKEWVKGAPVTTFEHGKTYVVEFWATWCGPCKVSIPHLTELQKAHPDVTFVGVSVFESDQAKVKPFVTEMGDKMAYRVCMDNVAPGAARDSGPMAKNWMEAAGQNGIPTAFVINGDGKVAWIGHPMEMEKPLDQIIAGKWDLTAAAADFKTRNEAQAKMMAARVKISQAKTPADRLAAVNSAISDDANMEPMLAGLKLNLLLANPAGAAGDPAADYLADVLTRPALKDEPGVLNGLAWQVVDPAAKQPRTDAEKKAALAIAQRAVSLTENKEPDILDTLAAAYFATGDTARAVETEERAVSLKKDSPELAAALQKYRAAAATANK